MSWSKLLFVTKTIKHKRCQEGKVVKIKAVWCENPFFWYSVFLRGTKVRVCHTFNHTIPNMGTHVVGKNKCRILAYNRHHWHLGLKTGEKVRIVHNFGNCQLSSYVQIPSSTKKNNFITYLLVWSPSLRF